MLKKGFLATNVIYVSIAHNKKILKKYFKELDIIFEKIKKSNPPKITNKIKIKCVIKVRFPNNSYILYINYNY